MKKILYIFIALLVSLSALSVQAQTNGDNYTLLEPLPCIEGTNNACKTGSTITEIDFNTYLGYIFKFGIALAGFLAVVMIIWGGFEYMFSESFTSKSGAKDRIWNAVIGLLGVLTSYLILATIDPRLVQIDSSLPKITVGTTESNRFRTRLEEDLNGLGAAARAESFALESQIRENDKQIKILTDKHGNVGELDETEQAELLRLKDQNDTFRAQQSKIVAHGLMDEAYKNVLSFINDTNTDPKRLADAVTANKAQIDKVLTDYGAKLKEANDNEGYQKLVLRTTFYKTQIDEQRNMMGTVKNYQETTNTPDKTRYERILNGYLTSYEAQIADIAKPVPEGMQRDAALEAQYLVTLESRVAILKDTLKKK